MSGQYLLGGDIGTSSAKLTLFDTEGNIIAKAKRSYPVNRPEEGYAEQNPEDYWLAVKECIREILAAVPGAAERIIGYAAAGQTSTEVMLGKDGKPVYPAITWQDTRASEQADKIAKRFTLEERHSMLGFKTSATNGTGARFLWLRENRPEIAERIWKVMQPKDYVNYKLTGETASDAWSYRSLVNINTFKPACPLLDFIGMPEDVLCGIMRSYDVCGRVSAAGAEETGLRAGTLVACGFSDSIGTVLSSGVLVDTGLAYNCTGTSEIVGVSLRDIVHAPGLVTMPGYIVGSHSVIYGTTQSGSSSLTWLYNNILHETDFDGGIMRAAEVPAGAGGVVFLPYLNGERAPIWDSRARGAFIGLSAAHDSRHLTRAVLEGVSMSVRHCLEIAANAAGELPRELRLMGGGSRSSVWNQIRADVCQIPVTVTQGDEGCTPGAAMLVGYAAGIWKSLAEASAGLVRTSGWYEPDVSKKPVYDAAFEAYRNEYRAQKEFREKK
jgi:xylulokinase